MKEPLRGIRFRAVPEILQAVDHSIRTINTTGAAKGILRLPLPEQEGGWRLWLHSLKVAQLLRSADCLHTNQSRSYLNHLVYNILHNIYNLLFPRLAVITHNWIVIRHPVTTSHTALSRITVKALVTSNIIQSVCLVGKGRLKERCGLEPRTNFFFPRLRNRQKLVRIRFENIR